MALTLDLLKANAATAMLSEDQMKAVVEMSVNDETTVLVSGRKRERFTAGWTLTY